LIYVPSNSTFFPRRDAVPGKSDQPNLSSSDSGMVQFAVVA
jgi:hypothetical protein